jgi:hypothetical protein
MTTTREGAAGAERLVSLACADGDVCDFSCERGAERQVQRRNVEATGYYWNTATSTIDGTIQRTPLFEAPQSLGLGLNKNTVTTDTRVFSHNSAPELISNLHAETECMDWYGCQKPESHQPLTYFRYHVRTVLCIYFIPVV